MSTKIKICGITNVDDARCAVSSGADYIGLIFAPSSKRSVSQENARKILLAVDNAALSVGVFQNEAAEVVNDLSCKLGLSLVQLHGNETPAYCSLIRTPLIKVFELQEGFNFEMVAPFLSVTQYILFDRPKGVNDTTFIARATAILKQSPAWLPPFFLAGGLIHETVGKVVAELQPYAVDVCSGIEIRPGKKHYGLLSEFCQSVRQEVRSCKH